MDSNKSTKIIQSNLNFSEYVKQFYSKKGEEKTHTRIASPDAGISGGAYYIPNDKMIEFREKYCNHVFVNRKEEYMTEIQLSEGPILVDIDERYDSSIQHRLHSKEDIERIVSLYLNELANLYDFDTETEIPIFIFEKPNINKTDTKYTKDGIHMIIGIHSDRIIQYMLRNKVLKNIGEILNHLPLKNPIDDILDDNVSRIVNPVPWQMYGSRKPGHEAYELKYYYIVKYCGKQKINNEDEDEDENEEIEYPWECDEKNVDYFDVIKNYELLSAHCTKHASFPLNDNIKREYEEIKTNRPKRSPISKFPSLKKKIQSISYSIDEIKNYEQLTSEIDRIFSEETKNYELRETHNYVMCLPESYYEPYNKWIRVGWALRNTNEKLFLTWVLFSSKSEKFSYDKIPEFYDMWCSFDMRNSDGLTKRSIMYWAKSDATNKYNDVYKKTVDYYINKTLSCEFKNISGFPETTIVDLTTVLYQMCKGQFVCASIRNNIWYEFNGHKWSECDSGISLRKIISNEMHTKYSERINTLNDKKMVQEEDNQSIKKDKSASNQNGPNFRASDICLKLRNPTMKSNIMKEAQEQFYDKEFIKNIDSKPYLLCFNNGVIDFKEKKFRPGQPDDNITKSTNIDYIKLDRKKHAKIIKEIETFFEQLFPILNVRKTMWEHLASCLIGINFDQTFTIYNGCGSNGKSKLIELMTECLGDYKGVVPVTLITQQRGKIGGTSPEIANLQGIRLAVMQEPSKGDRIYEGPLKELTGDKAITARALYKDVVTFAPQFKLVTCTNVMPEIVSADDGTRRRFVKIDFISKFTDNPRNDNPDMPYQFKIDKRLDEKFKTWAPILMAMLVEIAFETEGMVSKCAEIEASTLNYCNSQDYISQFIPEKIKKVEGRKEKLKKSEVYETFKKWYGEQFGKNIPKGSELYDELTKKYGEYRDGWKNIEVIYENIDECEEE